MAHSVMTTLHQLQAWIPARDWLGQWPHRCGASQYPVLLNRQRGVVAGHQRTGDCLHIILDIQLLEIPCGVQSREWTMDCMIVLTGRVCSRFADSAIQIVPGPSPPPVPTRLQAILTSEDTINIIYDTKPALSLAVRLAHDLQLYHRLDSAIFSDMQVANLDDRAFAGNSIIIGTLKSNMIQRLLKKGLTSFNLKKGRLHLGDCHLPTYSSECESFDSWPFSVR